MPFSFVTSRPRFVSKRRRGGVFGRRSFISATELQLWCLPTDGYQCFLWSELSVGPNIPAVGGGASHHGSVWAAGQRMLPARLKGSVCCRSQMIGWEHPHTRLHQLHFFSVESCTELDGEGWRNEDGRVNERDEKEIVEVFVFDCFRGFSMSKVCQAQVALWTKGIGHVSREDRWSPFSSIASGQGSPWWLEVALVLASFLSSYLVSNVSLVSNAAGNEDKTISRLI